MYVKFLQLVDILKGYVDMGVMMQKPNAGGERELQRHYKVCILTIDSLCIYTYYIYIPHAHVRVCRHLCYVTRNM